MWENVIIETFEEDDQALATKTQTPSAVGHKLAVFFLDSKANFSFDVEKCQNKTCDDPRNLELNKEVEEVSQLTETTFLRFEVSVDVLPVISMVGVWLYFNANYAPESHNYGSVNTENCTWPAKLFYKRPASQRGFLRADIEMSKTEAEEIGKRITLLYQSQTSPSAYAFPTHLMAHPQTMKIQANRDTIAALKGSCDVTSVYELLKRDDKTGNIIYALPATKFNLLAFVSFDQATSNINKSNPLQNYVESKNDVGLHFFDSTTMNFVETPKHAQARASIVPHAMGLAIPTEEKTVLAVNKRDLCEKKFHLALAVFGAFTEVNLVTNHVTQRAYHVVYENKPSATLCDDMVIDGVAFYSHHNKNDEKSNIIKQFKAKHKEIEKCMKGNKPGPGAYRAMGNVLGTNRQIQKILGKKTGEEISTKD